MALSVARPAGHPPSAAWWQLSGLVHPALDTPRRWLEPGAEPGAGAGAAPAARPRPAGADTPGGLEQSLLAAATLDDFAGRLDAACPGLAWRDGRAGAPLLWIGAGPSAEDLRTGRAFTGPAGQLVDRMLGALGLGRDLVYLTIAALRHRRATPPGEAALDSDAPLTRHHLALARPARLLVMGEAPARMLLGPGPPVSALRGRWHRVALAGGVEVPARVTFNPAYLLRRPEAKGDAWEDLVRWLHDTP